MCECLLQARGRISASLALQESSLALYYATEEIYRTHNLTLEDDDTFYYSFFPLPRAGSGGSRGFV